jgi:phage terminase Nu1 subunit (DNA packaging protein)
MSITEAKNMSDPNLDSPIFQGKTTVEQFARDCGRTTRTVRRWCDQGLPIEKRGNLRLIDIAKARAWLARGERGGCR